MRETSHLIRKSYFDILKDIEIQGVPVPVSDTYLNPNTSPADFRGGKCYILITDQYNSETTSNQCTFSEDVFLTVEVLAKYPNGTGSRLTVDLISDEVLNRILSLSGQEINIDQIGFQVLNTRKSIGQDFTEPGETDTVYRKRITFSQTIYQSRFAEIDLFPENTLNTTLNTEI